MPIIQTAKTIQKMKKGEVLEVVSTDQGIKQNMPAWCRTSGQEFLKVEEEEGGIIRAYVRKVKD